MIGIRSVFISSVATCLLAAGFVSAGSITFDFGNSNTANNSQNGGDGNWEPFADETTDISTIAATTIDGLQMTLVGTAVDTNGVADEFWGINNQGIGVITDDTTNGNSDAFDRRINGEIGENVSFSFDQDVFLSSLRLGAFAGNANGAEEVTITPEGGASIVISRTETTTSPTTDWPLGDVLVSAGTPITLTSTVAVGQGVLFNEITVDVIPEPATLMLAGFGFVGIVIACRRQQSSSALTA